MEYLSRFYDWLMTFIYGGGQAITWLLTPITIPDWLKYVGYAFTPIHVMNMLIEHFLMSPLELLSITGLITFFGVAFFKWIVS